MPNKAFDLNQIENIFALFTVCLKLRIGEYDIGRLTFCCKFCLYIGILYQRYNVSIYISFQSLAVLLYAMISSIFLHLKF